MNARDALIEEVAATIAVAELVGRHKTWGDLIERQKETYRGLAREVVGVVDRAKTPHADLTADGWQSNEERQHD